MVLLVCVVFFLSISGCQAQWEDTSTQLHSAHITPEIPEIPEILEIPEIKQTDELDTILNRQKRAETEEEKLIREEVELYRQLQTITQLQKDTYKQINDLEDEMDKKQQQMYAQGKKIKEQKKELDALKLDRTNASTKAKQTLEYYRINLELQTEKAKLKNVLSVLRRLDRHSERFEDALYYEGNRNYYRLSKPGTHTTHREREISCQLVGGYLARIETFDELKFVQSFIKKVVTKDSRIYISGIRGHNGRWSYVPLGDDLPYTRWGTGQPHIPINDCLVLNTNKKMNYNMDTLHCFSALPTRYLCEISEEVGDFEFASEFDGHVYLLSHAMNSLTDAQRKIRCHSVQGYLAEIGSTKEHDFIKNFLKQKNTNAKKVFVAGMKKNYGRWVYQRTDKNMTYTTWGPKQPSGFGNCIVLYNYGKDDIDYDMTDDWCLVKDKLTRFLCEIDDVTQEEQCSLMGIGIACPTG